MFDELVKYQDQGNFFFTSTDSLSEVCNAPIDRYGIYLVYALRKGKIELVYIGKSGIESIDGLREHLVNGLHTDDIEHKNSWPVQMMIEDVDALHIHWYVTIDKDHHNLPKYMKSTLIQKYQSIYGQLPRWNVKP